MVRQTGRVLAQGDIVTAKPLQVHAYELQASETESWFEGACCQVCQITKDE